MKNIVFLQVFSKKSVIFCEKSLVLSKKKVKCMKNNVFYKHTVKYVNFKQNCDFQGLGEESEQTDSPTHTLIIVWEVGGWREVGTIELIACELHPSRIGEQCVQPHGGVPFVTVHKRNSRHGMLATPCGRVGSKIGAYKRSCAK